MLGCSLREDGAHVFHNEEEIAIFRFDNDWDLLTIEVDGVEYSLDGGHEADDQIQGWMETDPGLKQRKPPWFSQAGTCVCPYRKISPSRSGGR